MTTAPPKVFVSSTSKDLGSVRELVKDALLTMGCHPVEQTVFAPGEHFQPVMDRLRELMEDCEAVVHLSGMRYGLEPKGESRPEGAARRSYTQLEVELARELKKKLYVFICPPDFPYDPDHGENPEPGELRRLQAEWRVSLTHSDGLYTPVEDRADLEKRVRELQIEKTALKRRVSKNTLRLAGALVTLALGIGWMITRQVDQPTTDEVREIYESNPEQLAASLRKQIEDLARTEIGKLGGDWKAIIEIEMQRDRQVAKADDLIRSIRDGLTPRANPVFVRAAGILADEKGGSAETLAYLGAERPRVIAEADRLAALESGAEDRKREGLRPILLEAEIHENRFEWAEALEDLRLVTVKAPQWWVAHTRLGNFLESRSQWKEADRHLRLALAIAETDEEKARSQNNIAALLYSQGNYGEAEPLYREAMETNERVLGREHPDTVMLINNLAALLESQGNCEEAEPLYREAMETNKRVLGRKHPRTLSSIHNLAGLLTKLGGSKEAELLYREALESREQVQGRKHPETVKSIGGLALLLLSKGNYEEAEPLFREALKTDEEVLGRQHPDTLTSINNLAIMFDTLGDSEKAEPLYREALTTREQVLGRQHPDTLTSINNLATLLESQAHFDEAEALYREALEGMIEALGAEHPSVEILRENLEEMLHAKEKQDAE